MRNAQLTIARLERSFNGGLNLPMIHSVIRSGMLRIRNRMTNNAVIIKRIIKLSILQAQMRRLPSLFSVYLCRCKKARRAYRCSARTVVFIYMKQTGYRSKGRSYYEKNSSDAVPDLVGNIRMRWNTAFYRMQLETGKAGENKPRIHSRGRGCLL